MNGVDLSQEPLIERKRLLQQLLPPSTAQIFYNDHNRGHAPEVFEHACLHNLEGIIVKRADAVYTPGTCKDLAQNKMPNAGRVGTGFDHDTLLMLSEKFQNLAQRYSPFVNPPAGGEARGVHWLRPELVAEVNFAEWTESNVIRHAAFVGLREDKPGREIVRQRVITETAEQNTAQPDQRQKKSRAKSSSAQKASATDSPHVAGVALSNASRVLFPSVGWTKLDLARYYEQVADWVKWSGANGRIGTAHLGSASRPSGQTGSSDI